MGNTSDIGVDEAVLQRGELQLLEAIGTAHGIDGEQLLPRVLGVVGAFPEFGRLGKIVLERLRDTDQFLKLGLDRLAFVNDANRLAFF
ncbi:hypothetical protein D3C77_556300 [compost metagenome]